MTNESKLYTAAVIGVGKAGDATGVKGGGHQIGYTHAGTFQRNARVQLAAGADINAENLRVFQEKFDVPQGFSDYNEMLRELRPDLVSIGTYVGLHRRMIVDAARAGVKGIICEKPFLASPADIRAVREVAQETGVKITVAHIRRHFPAFRRAKEIYQGGTIGEPLMCIAGIPDWDLSEWGAHWLDMFRFFHDDRPVEWVMGQARVRDARGYGHAMEEHAVAYFGFEGGGKAILDGGKAMNGDATMTLVGTNGSVRVLAENALVIDDAQGRREESFADDPQSSYEYVWDRTLSDLIDNIEGAPEPTLGLTSMLQTSELNLAAYLSAVRGDRVDLPLQDDSDEWPVEELARRAAAK